MNKLSIAPQIIENRTFEEIRPGDAARSSKTVTQQDIDLFAVVSGDVNPAHLDPAYASTDMFHHVVAHGLIGAGLISSVLGTQLPGPGTVYLAQNLRFLRPVLVGDTVTATLTVTEKDQKTGDIVLDCRCTNQDGAEVTVGTAHVRAPTEKVRRPRVELPEVRLSRHERFRHALTKAASLTPMPTAVVFPCDEVSLGAAIDAARAGLIAPMLIGPETRIKAVALEFGFDLAACRIIDAPDPGSASQKAAALARSGEARMLMKGSLHTEELLHVVVAAESGLRTDRRLSHVYLLDVPSYPRPLLITDAAINIEPDLAAKRDIVQNAIDLARIMGIERPKVALLSAVETVNPKLSSTLDAAALCKMADRGQITGGDLDGPLGFDNAVSPTAAAQKGIVSRVAGQADILVVPNLEAGNMLAKQLTFLAGADAAGVVLGARVPIILTSRADSERTRLASCAVGVLLGRAEGAGRA